jgi:hypothetical protein
MLPTPLTYPQWRTSEHGHVTVELAEGNVKATWVVEVVRDGGTWNGV